MESKELAIALARALDAKKARDIRVIRVHDLTTVTDYFVIATGTSTTHVGALADEADFQLGRQGVNVLRTEGHDGKRWILLDYGSVIVHVFTQEAHDFYDLEHLWADGEPMPESEWRLPEDRADGEAQ
ncbi:MAG TPA: ribosome silencing factor [Candidatus Gemmiger faecavium]|nr:ribosome silencing factor [Candidatus Gemmiger faecavium]